MTDHVVVENWVVVTE